MTLLLTIASSIAIPPPASVHGDDWVTTAVHEQMESKRIPGAVVGVVDSDGRVSSHAFGLRDVEPQLAMTTDTLFQIGSVTKPFTAALTLRLVDSAQIDLESTVGDLVPDLPLAGAVAGITVEQLLTHTSGLPRDPVNRKDLPDSPGVMLPYSTPELREGLQRTSLTTSPGTWSYSNLGYFLLGHLLELASGEDYRTLLNRELLTPLEMGDSGIDPSPDQERRLAVHYWPEDEQYVARQRWEIGEVSGAIGLFSSVTDLSRFVTAQYSRDGHLEPVRDLLHLPRVSIPGPGARSMSCGWFVDNVPNLGQLVGHGGEVDGHSACVAVALDHDAGLIVLCNQGGDSAESLCRALLPGFIAHVLTLADQDSPRQETRNGP